MFTTCYVSCQLVWQIVFATKAGGLFLKAASPLLPNRSLADQKEADQSLADQRVADQKEADQREAAVYDDKS